MTRDRRGAAARRLLVRLGIGFGIAAIVALGASWALRAEIGPVGEGPTAADRSMPDAESEVAGLVSATLTEAGRVPGVGDTPLARCRGRVVDAATGAPVAGVPVFATAALRWRWTPEPPSAAGRSDERGEYSLAGVPPGEAIVFAFGAGWVSEHLTEIDHDEYNPLLVARGPRGEAESEVRVVRAGSVRGRILSSDGGAVPEARVRASETGHGDGHCFDAPLTYDFGFVPAPPEVVADAEGRYAIDTLLPGVTYEVAASAGAAGNGSASVSARAGAEASCDVRVAPPPPTRRVVVRVVEQGSGIPIAGARVGPAGDPGDGETRVATTGADGTARIGPLAEGSWRVRATASGRMEGFADVEVDQDAEARPVAATVALELGRALFVRVLMPDGAPAQEVSLALKRGNGAWEFRGGPRTGPGGTAALDGLPRVPLRIDASLTRGGTTYEGTAEAEEADAEVTMRLAEREDDAPEVVRVRVVGPDGAAIARATGDRVTRLSATYVGTRHLSLLDGFLDVPPPEHDDDAERVWWLEVRGAADPVGRRLNLSPARAGPFRTVDEVRGLVLRMGPGRSIAGRVVDEAGVGIRGLKVTADPVRAPGDPKGWPSHAEAWTPADGGFLLDGLGDLEYALRTTVTSRQLAAEPVRARAGTTDVTIRLAAAVAVEITVLDDRGQPLADATVCAGRDEDAVRLRRWLPRVRGRDDAEATTDAEGRARLVHLAPGVEHVLLVEPPYDRRTLLPRTVRGWVPHDDSVALVKQAQAAGRVVDRKGAPLADASVDLAPPDDAPFLPRISAWTDAEGRFRLEGDLPRGPATLIVRVGRLPPQSFPVPSLEGEILLAADAGATLVVALTGLPEDAELPDLQTLEAAADGKGARVDGVRDPTGRVATFRGLLETSTYTFFARGSGRVGYRSGVRPGGRVEIPMEPEKTVSGRLVVPADMRFATKYVEVSGLGFSVMGQVADDGRFEVRGLPPGPCVVQGSAYAHDGSSSNEADAAEGQVETVTGSVLDVVLVKTSSGSKSRRPGR